MQGKAISSNTSISGFCEMAKFYESSSAFYCNTQQKLLLPGMGSAASKTTSDTRRSQSAPAHSRQNSIRAHATIQERPQPLLPPPLQSKTDDQARSNMASKSLPYVHQDTRDHSDNFDEPDEQKIDVVPDALQEQAVTTPTINTKLILDQDSHSSKGLSSPSVPSLASCGTNEGFDDDRVQLPELVPLGFKSDFDSSSSFGSLVQEPPKPERKGPNTAAQPQITRLTPDLEAKSEASAEEPERIFPDDDGASKEAFISKSESSQLLQVYARAIFNKADDDKDGALNEWEFMSLVQSPTLGLNISDEEAREMMQDCCDDVRDGVRFSNFIPLIKVRWHRLLDFHRISSSSTGPHDSTITSEAG